MCNIYVCVCVCFDLYIEVTFETIIKTVGQTLD